jgi:zinc transport system substrate-binding protein
VIANRRRTMHRETLLALMIIVGLAACGGGGSSEVTQEADAPDDTLTVYTVNYPLAFFAERIGGEMVEVVFPAPADEDPAFWSPDADTIAAYQGADLILLNGAGYAKWVERATLPATRLVDTSAAFADMLIPLEEAVTHSHGPEGAHEHGGYAFTTWLDPTLAIQQAQAVEAAISNLRPEAAPDLHKRMELLKGDLLNLDGRLAVAANSLGDEPLLFSHPVYQYLINRFDLNGVEVHWEPDETPDGQAWDHLEELLESHVAEWMLWEGKPLDDTVSGLAEIGVESAIFDPCGNRPEKGDYLTVMSANATSLKAIGTTNG